MRKYLLLILGLAATFAANAQSALKLGAGPAGTGPAYGNQIFTFYDGVTATPITVTFSLSNQQFGLGTLEGLPADQGVLFGGTIQPGVGTNAPIVPRIITDNLNGTGAPSNSHFTACSSCTPGTGVTVSSDKGATIFLSTDALIDTIFPYPSPVAPYEHNKVAKNAITHFADITLTFSTPVSNPVIQLSGLGGGFNNTGYGGAGYLGWAADVELLTPGHSMSILSGSSYFSLNGSTIYNSAPILSASVTGNSYVSDVSILPPNDYNVTGYGAGGSVVIYGTNITSLSFRLYLRGDGGTGANPQYSRIDAVSGERFIFGVSMQKPVTVTGNVFHDPDGGNVNNSSGTANMVPDGMYISLVDADGKVVVSVPVNTDGTYTIPDVFEGTYTTVLSLTNAVQGIAAPVPAVPTGWERTGGYNGLPDSGNSGNDGISAPFVVAEDDVDNINFSIEQAPNSDDKIYTFPTQPAGGSTHQLDGLGGNPPLMSGTDADGTSGDGTYTGNTGTNRDPQGVVITSLPTNGVELWYDGVQVTAADLNTTLFEDPSRFSIKLTGAGYTSTSFEYAYVDAAGVQDPTPATYTLNWALPLPVRLISFDAYKKGNTAELVWATASEQNNKGFDIERSTDGRSWTKIGFVASRSKDGNSSIRSDYNLTDDSPAGSKSYYRLKQVDLNGKYEYSAVRMVSFGKNSEIGIYPSPAKDNVTIEGLLGDENIRIYDVVGRLMYQAKAEDTVMSIALSAFGTGTYHISIISVDGHVSSHKLVIDK